MLRVLAVVLAAVAAPRLADACSCVALSPRQLYDQADAVFVGDVSEVSEAARRKTVRLKVVRADKGSPKEGETVAVMMPGGSSASCSLDVAVPARVVIFASASDGRLTTNLCQGSYRLQPGKPLPKLPPPA